MCLVSIQKRGEDELSLLPFFVLPRAAGCTLSQAHALPGVSHHRIPRPSRVFSRGANPRALSNTDLDVASPRFARSRRKQTSAFRNPCRGSTKTRCKPPSRSRRTSRWTSCVAPTWPSVSACLRRRPSPSRSTLSEVRSRSTYPDDPPTRLPVFRYVSDSATPRLAAEDCGDSPRRARAPLVPERAL